MTNNKKLLYLLPIETYPKLLHTYSSLPESSHERQIKHLKQLFVHVLFMKKNYTHNIWCNFP